MTIATEPLRVAVAGGGVAAAELLLALRSLAGDRVALEVIAPDADLPVRAASTGAAVGASVVQAFDLRELAGDTGAALRIDSVEAVASRARRLRLASGAVTTYDALVLATGARARVGVPGALTFRDHRAALVGAAIDEIEAVQGGRIVFSVPAGVAWTLPVYELSLLAAVELARRGAVANIILVTPERSALEVFGPAVSDRVTGLLRDHDIRLMCGTAAAGVHHGRLVLASGESIAADRVIAVPRLVGRRIAGVPAGWNGFVDTDEQGRVRELTDVYAAGDLTGFPVKQGGLAGQQADVLAALLARRAGADVDVPRTQPVLRSLLLGAPRPLYLRAELDAKGRPLGSSTVTEEPLWWPAAKLFAAHLTPWMATRAASRPRAAAA